jgi:hypothetical protein
MIPIDPEVLRRWRYCLKHLGDNHSSVFAVLEEIDALLRAHDAATKPDPTKTGVVVLSEGGRLTGYSAEQVREALTPPDAAKGDVCECGHERGTHTAQLNGERGDCGMITCDCMAYRAAPGEGANDNETNYRKE